MSGRLQWVMGVDRRKPPRAGSHNSKRKTDSANSLVTPRRKVTYETRSNWDVRMDTHSLKQYNPPTHTHTILPIIHSTSPELFTLSAKLKWVIFPVNFSVAVNFSKVELMKVCKKDVRKRLWQFVNTCVLDSRRHTFHLIKTGYTPPF